MSTNWSRRKERERGFPRFCKKCGAGFDKNHLFKWTYEAAVEEIEDMKSLFDEKFGHFELQNQRCEDLIKSYDKKIEDLTDALTGFGNEIKEMKELVHGYEKDVKTLKKMVICGVGMMIGYYYFAM
ncbi:hypothetical protein BRARA_K00276 [Brassica rapa]|uniref:Uncharacterized protein n=1 Tax=Brassica campestris TaxID=3711 RepID=A0A397L6L4_BRACM|nr:hypothetical protein BRARA_K00276 [Brassica rapa]